MQVSIKVVELSGADLAVVPEAERVLLVQLGHLHNTINLLRRWLLSARPEGRTEAEVHAALAQHSLAARMLAGILCEGWMVLQKSFFGAGVSRGYANDLSTKGAAALATLKCYFSQTNLLKTVRDRFAFHFDRDEILRQLRAFGESDSSTLYISEEAGNSLY